MQPPHQPPVLGEAVVPATDEELDESASFPIVVGVGASAGGLEALTELLHHLPGDTGLAFVLIQHLDPTHESHLTELLSKASKMPVSEVKGGTRAKANHVYVIPAKCNLGISDGVLETPPRPESGRNMPVDAFFRALAADRGSDALGVILSGTASDGTLGLQAIKAAGGITFAQDVRTAKYDGMPGSAIAAGVVDFILPPAGIARQLAAFTRDAQCPRRFSKRRPIILRKPNSPGCSGWCGPPPEWTSHTTSTTPSCDASSGAWHSAGFETLDDYIGDLERNRDEVTVLCESFFVTVTAFFREPAVFEELKKRVFPALVDNREPGDPIRIWVAGCSTGEEAYSIAMCLAEFLEEAELSLPFEDVCHRYQRNSHHQSPRRHLRGCCSGPMCRRNGWDGSSAERIARTRSPGRFATRAFSPRITWRTTRRFSKLDLICCCNVLIYLGAALQRKVLSTLHYALKPTGFLLLGPSESIGSLSESFHQMEKTHKIYCKRPDAGVRRAAPE